MSKIKLSYKGSDYVLEYTRRSVQLMEEQGFNANELTSRPMTMLPLMFRGAFFAHHRNLKPTLVDEIFDNLTGKDALIGKLAEMYSEPFNELMGEPAEEAAGNVEWTAI